MKKKNEASDQTGNTTDIKIVSKCPHSLQPSQARLASFFYQNIGRELNTFNFRDEGIHNPSQRASELIRFKGALIDIRYADATDSAGELHHNVGHYIFNGWEI